MPLLESGLTSPSAVPATCRPLPPPPPAPPPSLLPVPFFQHSPYSPSPTLSISRPPLWWLRPTVGVSCMPNLIPPPPLTSPPTGAVLSLYVGSALFIPLSCNAGHWPVFCAIAILRASCDVLVSVCFTHMGVRCLVAMLLWPLFLRL